MIHYLAYSGHLYTMQQHLRFWGDTLRKRVLPGSYEKFSQNRTLPSGVYIFSDIERLTPDMTAKVARRWNALNDSPERTVLLNHPTRSMKRYELLRTLYEGGVNDFDVYRLDEARWPKRYPVFLRPELHFMAENDVPLIDSRPALEAAVERLLRRGAWRDDILVIEFCDTADRDGLFRKYSAFRIGSRIVPRHINFSRGWFIKSPDATIDPDTGVDEEWRYLNDNPHAGELMSIFEAAHIQYGRIDYALRNGRIQVWEINTNPNMGRLQAKPHPDSPRWPVHSLFAQKYEEALLALEDGQAPRPGRTP